MSSCSPSMMFLLIYRDIKERFMVDHANRINGDGILVITSSLTRFQQSNREDVIHKLQEMLDYSSEPPKVRVINTGMSLGCSTNDGINRTNRGIKIEMEKR